MAHRHLRPEDLARYRLPSGLIISPDGAEIIAVLSRALVAKKQNRYQRDLWQVSVRTGKSRRLWKPDRNVSSPSYSPDGQQILFLATHVAGSLRMDGQLFVSRANGIGAHVLQTRCKAIAEPAWSPDGKLIAFLAAVENEQPDPHARFIRRLSYRMDSGGYHHTYRRHLFVIPAQGGKARQVTHGEWSVEHFHWSPSGGELFFTTSRSADPILPKRSLCAVSIRNARIKELCSLAGGMSRPQPSPNGRFIAVLGHDFHAKHGTNVNIYLFDRHTRRVKNVSGRLDLSVESSVVSDSRVASPYPGVTWSADGRQLTFLASTRGATHLFSLDLSSRRVTQQTAGAFTIEAVAHARNAQCSALIAMTPTALPEIWLLEGTKLRQVSQLNTAVLRPLRLSKPQEFTTRSYDGRSIQGWYMAPTRPFASKRRGCPAILQIHGGPHSAYGMGFMSEFHLLNAAGYGVFYVNPRGSSSYGERWTSAVCGRYGQGDYQDIMLAVRNALQTFPIDRRRLGVAGGSYGGFMTNWIIGHTNLFRAALTHRSISNFVSFVGTSDIGWSYSRHELSGLPWERLQHYWRYSPLAYVKRVRTPLLIMHAEEDYRCPIEQAEQLFTALKVLGRDVEFIRFPGESHELTRSGRPLARIANARAVLDWFGRKLP